MAITRKTKLTKSRQITKKRKTGISEIDKAKARCLRKNRSEIERNKGKDDVSSEPTTKTNLPQISYYSENDEWTDLYQKLLNSCWRWSTSGSKLANYTYFNPGIKNIKDGEHGKDYFFLKKS